MSRLTAVVLLLSLISTVARSADASSIPTPAENGRLLLGTLNCTACHAPSEAQSRWLLPKVSPKLAGIARRVSPEWLTSYLASPQQVMPGTTMPDVLGAMSPADRAGAAESLTHYLLSQPAAEFHRVMPDRAAVARGRLLYQRIGCVACHAPQEGDAKGMQSVPLPNMQEKWSFAGLRQFLLDPLATRPSGRMPAMQLTDQEATDLAHYLLRGTRVAAPVEVSTYRGQFRSLDDIDTAELVRTGPADRISVDQNNGDRPDALKFSAWLTIDAPGDYTFYFAAVGASRFAIDGNWLAGDDSWEQNHVDAKVKRHLDAGPHELRVDYKHRGRKPAAMSLEWESVGIRRQAIPASHLSSEREPVEVPKAFVVDPMKAAAGRELYEKLNCAACHDGKSTAKSLPTVSALNVERGCLAAQKSGDVPDFHLDLAQRQSLASALKWLNDANSTAPSPKQRIVQTMAAFNCGACHVRDGVGGVSAARDPFFTSSGEDLGDEGRIPPRLDGVGDKLQPAWLTKVLTEGASVRQYLNTRMPQFGKENVGHLADLFVAVDRTKQELPKAVDAANIQKQAGRKMVGTDGLSCIVCHRFNRQPAQTMQIIDLATAADRLNQDWFRRFLLDPNHFHPGTRMPAFWADHKSLLPGVLGGDTDRQIAAIWTYLSDGPGARFPEGLSRQSLELVVGGDAVVYRGKLWEAGFRAVAIGYPGQVNEAFDAEEMRLSLLWRGRFLNVAPHWTVQGMGRIRPLGTDVVVFQHGSPLAILTGPKAPWPTATSKALGMRFHGYQFDEARRPTLLYTFQAAAVEDFATPPDGKKAALHRTITFTNPPPEGLYMRLAVGKLTQRERGSWRLNDAMTLTVSGGGEPFTRGQGEQQELLVPVHFATAKHQLEVEYEW